MEEECRIAADVNDDGDVSTSSDEDNDSLMNLFGPSSNHLLDFGAGDSLSIVHDEINDDQHILFDGM